MITETPPPSNSNEYQSLVEGWSNISETLAEIPQWMPCKFGQTKENGRFTKQPCDENGISTDWTNPNHWRTLAETIEIAQPQGLGIGLVLTPSRGIVCIDIDNCITNGISNHPAQQLLHRFDSLAEISVSGSGLHIFIRAKKPDSRCKVDGVEIFDRKFIAITGDYISGIGIVENRQAELDVFFSTQSKQLEGTAHIPMPFVRQTPRLTELIRIMNSKCLDPDDYDEWIRVGMVLKYHFSEHPAALAAWDAWSRLSEKYKQGEPEKKWRELKPRGDITCDWFYARAHERNFSHIDYNELFESIEFTEGGDFHSLAIWQKNNYRGSPLDYVEKKKSERLIHNNNTPLITGMTLDELLQAKFPEPKYVIPGMLAEGLTLFCGKPKVGKSWFVLYATEAVSSGGMAFGSIKVEAGDVLYLALEDNLRRLQKRFSMMSANPNGRLRVETNWPRIDEGGITMIEEWVTEHPEARLVVIDTLARFRSTKANRSESYQSDSESLIPLHELAKTYGVSVVVVHHTRKQESSDYVELVSGTLGLTGVADSTLVLMRDRGAADAFLHGTGRDIPEFCTPLVFEEKTGRWSKIGLSASEARATNKQLEIVQLLKSSSEGMMLAEIAEKLGDSKQNTSNKLKRLFDRSMVKQDHKTSRWSCPP